MFDSYTVLKKPDVRRDMEDKSYELFWDYNKSQRNILDLW